MDSARTDELQRMNYEIAQAIAPTWERRRADIEEVAAPVRSWLVHALDPRPGDTVLELAAGNGDTGFDAALHIGSRGTLLTTDFSPAMLESARRRARTLALENVKFLVIDAQHIELEDDSVDGVICRYGYMLMVDPWAALTETRRVLRPGGRLVLAVWGPPAKNPFFTAAVGPLVAAHHLPAPDPDGPGVFALADRADLSALLLTAGFDEARIQEVAVRFTLPDVAAYLALVSDTAGPIGLTIQALSADDRAALAAAVSEQLVSYVNADGLDIPGLVLCATAA